MVCTASKSQFLPLMVFVVVNFLISSSLCCESCENLGDDACYSLLQGYVDSFHSQDKLLQFYSGGLGVCELPDGVCLATSPLPSTPLSQDEQYEILIAQCASGQLSTLWNQGLSLSTVGCTGVCSTLPSSQSCSSSLKTELAASSLQDKLRVYSLNDQEDQEEEESCSEITASCLKIHHQEVTLIHIPSTSHHHHFIFITSS